MSTKQSRRRFIQTTGSLCAAAGAPAILSGQPKKAAAETVGHGDFQYTTDHQWGKLDARKTPVVHFHEMVLDARGRLACSVVSDRADVLLFNKDGRVMDTFHHDLPEPHGLTLAGEGSDQTFWLTDSAAGRVLNLDPDGRIIRELTVPADEIPEGSNFKPTETTVADNGDVYVADGYGTNKIFHFDGRGQVKNVFGGPDHFQCCHGILVDGRRGQDELLITSRSNQQFQRWTMDGKHLATHELPGLKVCRPVMAGDHTLFAVIWTKSNWNYDGMVAVLDKDFRVVSLPGGSEPTDQESFREVAWDGQTFLNPHDVCQDGDGNLFVPQWLSGMTQPVRLRRV
ncbi:MAG: 6-bladed beta-propeller [Lewinella sp.]